MEAAFFDLDKTVISRSSSFALGKPMYQAGMVSRSQLLRGAYAQLVFQLLGADARRMEKAKNAMLELTRGWEQGQLEDLVREVVIEVIDPFVYQEALDLMAEHRAAGRKIFIVSTAPEEIVRPLAEHFGANGVVATRAELIDGRYTGNLAFYAYGQSKADAIRSLAKRARINLADSYAYSDSLTDLPMLEAVGHPFAANPSRELRKEAEARGWEVLHFERPVRLIPRPPVPKPKPTIAVLVGVVATGIAAWLYMRARRGDSRLG
jgi:HAD superfamily hydrolase (TIGR01490 family)